MLANFPGYERLKNIKRAGTNQWACCCPAHNDSSPSLYIKLSDDRWLVHCHAGCSYDDICQSLGIQSHDLFFDKKRKPQDTSLEETIIRLGELGAIRSDADFERFARAKLNLARMGEIAQDDSPSLGISKPSISPDLD